MYRFIGEQTAYSYFNSLAITLTFILCLFFYKSKRNSISLFSRYAIYGVSKFSKILGIIVEIILVSVESLLVAGVLALSTNVNKPFGDLVGTGGNYFGLLSVVSIAVSAVSLVIVSNPLKQVDFASVLAPFMLIFVKTACFMNGCCWGIAWEHGFYNSHPDHPGYQVPVQAIEAFWALAIFVFFLWYRKKAKPGTMFPMYLILYSATRFCSEFFRREENVLGPFKTYHLLCMAGFVIGLILFLIMRKYGERMSDFFDKPHKKFELRIAQKEEQKALELAEERAQAENERLERLEKAKLAREKAKSHKK